MKRQFIKSTIFVLFLMMILFSTKVYAGWYAYGNPYMNENGAIIGGSVTVGYTCPGEEGESFKDYIHRVLGGNGLGDPDILNGGNNGDDDDDGGADGWDTGGPGDGTGVA